MEFTSFIAFAVGVLFGSLAGALLGGMTMLINGFFSPWGQAGLNAPFQMIGMAIAGILGGVFRSFAPTESDAGRFCFEAAVVGGLVALIYDLITNFGVGVQFILAGMDPALALVSALAYGSFFSLIHILSSGAVFGVLFLPFARTLGNLRVGDVHWLKKERLYS